VGDATVARFAAGRYRSTYRSLRPLLADGVGDQDTTAKDADESPERLPRTRKELDDETRAFALGLIDNWVEDPSNVRLLRIGLDLWPAVDVLEKVLALLQPFTEKGGKRKAPRRVAWYCLSEILRAGATETGFVEDGESMPGGVDILKYRKVLLDEATRLASLPPATLPWYLKQQSLLFLAVHHTAHSSVVRKGKSPETRHYRDLLRFLGGNFDVKTATDFSVLAILVRRSFLDSARTAELVGTAITPKRLEEIAVRDPSFALEIIDAQPSVLELISPRLRDDLCKNPVTSFASS